MKDKKLAVIVGLAFMVVITCFAVLGSDFLLNGNSDSEEAMDVASAEGIKEAVKYTDGDGNVTGYKVTANPKGFGGEIEVIVSFEADGKTISALEIGENSETPGLGAKVAEADFTSQFAKAAAPVDVKNINAVTGATISSTAVCTGINSAAEFLQ